MDGNPRAGYAAEMRRISGLAERTGSPRPVRTSLEPGAGRRRVPDAVRRLRGLLSRRETDLRELSARLGARDREVVDLRQEVGRLRRDLVRLRRGVSGALVLRLRLLRRRLFPDGTLGHRWVRILTGTLGAVRGAMAGLRGAMRSLPERVRRAVVAFGRWLGTEPAALAAALLPDADALAQRQMSWQAYAFLRYRRARRRSAGDDFSRLRVPHASGLISIVLPVYNGANYVGEAIESVFRQSYPDWELIIVDDGSTDDTPRIVAGAAARDRRVRVIRQENRKLPRALNGGFAEARGEFLTWISADNRMKPSCLAELAACLRRHSDWDLVYANMDVVGPDGQALRNSGWYTDYQRPPGSEHIHFPRETSELNVRANNHVGAAFLYRARVAYLLAGYAPGRFGMEDYDYWMRCNALLRVRHADFDICVYDYRLHPDSLTQRAAELRLTARREQLMIFEDFRRHFFQTPLIWAVTADPASTTAALLARRLEARMRASGGVCASARELAGLPLPRLWAPIAQVHVARAGADLRDAGPSLPGALRMLLTTDADLPPTVAEGWDLCVSWSDVGQPPRLADQHGWLASDDLRVLLSAMDLRCRELHLRRMEGEWLAPREAACEASVVLRVADAEAASGSLSQAVRFIAVHPETELLVVPHGRPGRLRSLATALAGVAPAALGPRVRFVACPLPGRAAAMNAALAEARGAVLCYLRSAEDCDVLPAAWLPFRDDARLGVVARSGWTARREALLSIGGFRTPPGTPHGARQTEERVAEWLIEALGWSTRGLRHADASGQRDGCDADGADPPSSQASPGAPGCREQRAEALAAYARQLALYEPLDGTPAACWQSAAGAMLAALVRGRAAAGRADVRAAAARLEGAVRRTRDELARLARRRAP
jgi:hypothetical protein